MLIMALVGGSEKARANVVQQLAMLINAQGVIFTMPPALSKPDRLALLQTKFNPARAISRLLLLNNLNSIEEFDWVRRFGGYVVHVDGLPSDVVPMQQHDFYVTAGKNSRGRFDCVEDCFAAIRLRYRQDAQLRSGRG